MSRDCFFERAVPARAFLSAHENRIPRVPSTIVEVYDCSAITGVATIPSRFIALSFTDLIVAPPRYESKRIAIDVNGNIPVGMRRTGTTLVTPFRGRAI